MRFAMWRLNLAIRDVVSFKHCFSCKHRSLKRVSYFIIFVIRENEIFMSVNRDPLFFRFVNRTRDPPWTTLEIAVGWLAMDDNPSAISAHFKMAVVVRATRAKSTTARTSSENVTSFFFNHFSIVESHFRLQSVL